MEAQVDINDTKKVNRNILSVFPIADECSAEPCAALPGIH
jgi:hypothetical protein